MRLKHRGEDTASPTVVIYLKSPVVPVKQFLSPLSASKPLPSPTEPLAGIIRPSIHTIGPEHEWALAIFDLFLLFAEFQACNGTSSSIDAVESARITAIEILRELPAWKLHWNEEDDALEEVSRQLRFQLSILGRILLFIVKQLPHDSSAHELMGSLQCAIFTVDQSEYMPERFFTSAYICSWTRKWLSYPLLNITASEQIQPGSPILTSKRYDHLSHHPSRNIWLFDQYLTPKENAAVSALKARVWRVTQNILLQLCASDMIERLLTQASRLSPREIDASLPSAAVWFLYAYETPSTPETLLRGWYDTCLTSPTVGPKGMRYAHLITQERKWWMFFKRSFFEIQNRDDLSLITRQYATRAFERMNSLDGSDRDGFHSQLELRVETGKKSTRI